MAVISHPDLRWKRCDIKSTNLLANVLANEAAHRAGAFEAILVDADGLVTEATHSSVLWVRDGRLEGTPEGPRDPARARPGSSSSGWSSELGIPFVEARVTLDELKAADEVILVGHDDRGPAGRPDRRRADRRRPARPGRPAAPGRLPRPRSNAGCAGQPRPRRARSPALEPE